MDQLSGALHRTRGERSQVLVSPAQNPSTQGHEPGMGGNRNTAAIYVRRAAYDSATDLSVNSRPVVA